MPLRCPALIRWALALVAIMLAGCSTFVTDSGQCRFFQNEYRLETHGRKTWFDHLVELDPGGFKVAVARDYEQHAPLKIAILPFTDRGSANYVVDKIPLTFRNQRGRERCAGPGPMRTARAGH